MQARMKAVKKALDAHLKEFDQAERLAGDPVAFPHRYAKREDVEAVSLIASCFAYGKVSLFFRVIEAIVERLGPSPAKALRGFDAKRELPRFAGVEYRFNKSRDIVVFLEALGRMIRDDGGPLAVLVSAYSPEQETVMEAASAMVGRLLAHAADVSRERFGSELSAGVKQLLPDPAKNSTCKRLCMWLRWMLRGPDAIDFGLAREIPASKLVIPLDTHIFRISNMLGLVSRKDQTLRTAAEITARLREFDPDDPLKYDFAICHIGISGFCRKGEEGRNCRDCALRGVCGAGA